MRSQIYVFVYSQYFPDWFRFSWPRLEARGKHKDPVPHSFDVAKGSTHMAVTREFVEYAVNDSRALDLLYWMRDVKVPDEHFFQTLSHSPQMNVPGAYIGQFYLSKLSNFVAPACGSFHRQLLLRNKQPTWDERQESGRYKFHTLILFSCKL